MIAMAEAFHFSHGFQPTMAPARARAAAGQADRQAYADAQSTYAKLDRLALRAVALEALHHRTGSRLNSARAQK